MVKKTVTSTPKKGSRGMSETTPKKTRPKVSSGTKVVGMRQVKRDTIIVRNKDGTIVKVATPAGTKGYSISTVKSGTVQKPEKEPVSKEDLMELEDVELYVVSKNKTAGNKKQVDLNKVEATRLGSKRSRSEGEDTSESENRLVKAQRIDGTDDETEEGEVPASDPPTDSKDIQEDPLKELPEMSTDDMTANKQVNEHVAEQIVESAPVESKPMEEKTPSLTASDFETFKTDITTAIVAAISKGLSVPETASVQQVETIKPPTEEQLDVKAQDDIKMVKKESEEIVKNAKTDKKGVEEDQKEQVEAKVNSILMDVEVAHRSADNTAKAIENHMDYEESAQVALSNGELSGQASTTNDITGDIDKIAPAQILDPTTAASVQTKNPLEDTVDTHLRDNDNTGMALISETVVTPNQDLDSRRNQGIASSANESNLASEPMDIVAETKEQKEARIAQEKEQKRVKAEQLGTEARQRDIEAKQVNPNVIMDTSVSDTRAKLRKEIDELAQTPEELVAFNDLMTSVDRWLPEREDKGTDADELRMTQLVRASLRRVSRFFDVKTAQPQSAKELLDLRVGEMAGELLNPSRGSGEQLLGTAIFAPNTALSSLFELQKQNILRITPQIAKAAQEEMQPYWNEFRNLQLNAGVTEMETMPTSLLKSSMSSLQASSKVRPDMDQGEEKFMQFMFFILHGRLNTNDPVTWRRFFIWSASLGYNDLTQAQINWLVTGNVNGDINKDTNFVLEEGIEQLDEEIPILEGVVMRREVIHMLDTITESHPTPEVQYPSRNTSPSAPGIDNSTHPNGSTSIDRQNQQLVSSLPSSVFNIPDPRFSKRGGKNIPNVRVITVKNDKYDPKSKKKKGDDGYEPEFITKEIPDIGVGSKDVQAHIDAAESDRLLSSLPMKLYAPIHAQACDRYLGSRNYQRLGLGVEEYVKNYSTQGFNSTDYQKMFNWNMYVMQLYGEMLYAFVTDIRMQRVVPVYNLATPQSVADEYMELNELVVELTRYQQESDDRADRVSGAGKSTRPLETELNKFFSGQEDKAKEQIFDANAMVISFPSDMPPSSNSDDVRPGGNPSGGGDIPDPSNPPTPDPDGPTPPTELYMNEPKDPRMAREIHPQILKDTSHPLVGSYTMDHGVVKTPPTVPMSLNTAVTTNMSKRVVEPSSKFNGLSVDDSTRHARMFAMFARR